MKKRVWLFCIFIGCLTCSACAGIQETAKPVSTVPLEQDTLEMEPDFSYAVQPQQPHILIDQAGYQCQDKKIAFFYGNELNETFEIRREETEEVVYEGTLGQVIEVDGQMLYTGIFTDFVEEGDYYIHQEQVGDSYSFSITKSIYNQKYKQLENILLKEKYTFVTDQAYVLANYMFIDEMFEETWTNISYIRAKVETLLNSQNIVTGAFYSEILDKPVDTEVYEGEISLSTTAQMAGVLAQYAYLYREAEDPIFINQCLQAAQKAYKYVEKYRDNTDTDAWYFAAVQLYRATRQYKYRTAILEYDTLPVESRSSTAQGYTILADFTYLSTPYGTDYTRCAVLLDSYLDKAQNISTNSSRENFYVLEDLDTMSDKEILEDMVILGVVNHVLSGQEYAGAQKNYIHYLSGVNEERRDFMTETIVIEEGTDCIDTANATKLLVVYGNLYEGIEVGDNN